MNLDFFVQHDFTTALKQFFEELHVPINFITDEPARPSDILEDKYNPNNLAHQLIREIYPLGVVNDAIFEGKETFTNTNEIKDRITFEYEGLLIFGVTLYERGNNLLPTRSQLADITRLLDQTFPYTPVVVVFRYDDYLALANTERRAYKQTWREGEKVGKVSILRDINVHNPHSAHIRLLHRLAIQRSGTKAIDSFKALYNYWQEVLDVSILNKEFYQELANWYFWAIKNVQFPGEPQKQTDEKEGDYLERVKSHRAQNVIRLITRFMFSWFIKEKHLIPAKLFDKEYLTEIMDLGNDNDSYYYKAILQNLFFATLNQEMDKREFRKNGQNYNVTNLYRYQNLFKAECRPDDQKALDLFKDIPFLNGGLFECLDKPGENSKVERIDGFSDRNDILLHVPNYLFFREEQEEDLSEEYGQSGKKYKQAKVKGFITLLNSYVFTVTENTPIEEDVALDPELLGKVFENLLASYNPETKTTARKQTGSFYTPREIVNYMVDESLIAYLKNELLKEEAGYLEFSKSQSDFFGNEARKGQLKIESRLDESPWKLKEQALDKHLHLLFSFDPEQPFEDEPTKEKIIRALDRCTILDPACGSGAFPMGILQKMVHVLQKLDPDNKIWKEVQREKVLAETEAAFDIEDKKAREDRLIEINNAFDQSINDPDYARKLYLIENCIYGVDIQPIAVQIAKLRFFISLIVDQKLNLAKKNLGIRPLPNLETKFVAANTLIELDKPQQLFIENRQIEQLKKALTEVRHRHFSAKTPKTKRDWRDRDKELREQISKLLENDGWKGEAAKQVANWDPYDQNCSAQFFDLKWMFGISQGFDVVIGNPPYVQLQAKSGYLAKQLKNSNYETFERTGDIYSVFYEKAYQILKPDAHLIYITSNKWMRAGYGKSLRKFFSQKTNPLLLIDFAGQKIFESATVDTNILLFQKNKNSQQTKACIVKEKCIDYLNRYIEKNISVCSFSTSDSWIILNPIEQRIKEKIERIGTPLEDWDINIYRGVLTGYNEAFIINGKKKNELIAADPKSAEIIRPILRGRDIKRYGYNFADLWLINTHNGVKERGINRINIDDYPAIKNHLDNYYLELKKRVDKGDTPYNLRNCAYMEDFFRPKLLWAETMRIHKQSKARFPRFGFDNNSQCVTDKTCFFATGENLKIVLAILNSTLGRYLCSKYVSVLDDGGYLMQKIYLEKIPLIKPSRELAKMLEMHIEKLIYKEELEKIENNVDDLVFVAYNLEEEEVSFIRSQVQ